MDIKYLQGNHLNSNKGLLFVGGSGDDKNSFSEIATLISKHSSDYSIVTFSYQDNSESSLTSQIYELTEVVNYMVHVKKLTRLTIFCTSMGAYCASHLAINQKYDNYLDSIIFFDPADYYLKQIIPDVQTWSGSDLYTPKKPVVSELLKKIHNPNTKIHVFHLSIKNYSHNGYLESDFSKRGKSSAKAFTRLNSIMVKSFYLKAPLRNRGQYLEIPNIPHAFERDGDILENNNKVANLIIPFL